jgi:hemerythrin-like domain-containing protein
MLTQIGAKPESDFSEPLGMLSDCHKRIQYFLQDLVRLAEGTSNATLDSDRRVALERALRYFRESAPRHTADEEESLFPLLRALKDDRLRSAWVKIEQLQKDHERADDAHRIVDGIGVRWLDDGVLNPEDADRLKANLKGLSELYERHLAVEDKDIFPIAAAVLSANDQIEMGRQMATRRGLSAEIVKTEPQSRGLFRSSFGVEVKP